MRALIFAMTFLAAIAAPRAERAANAQALAPVPLTLKSARVSLDGTSNIHAYTASTTTVTIRSMELAAPATADVLADVLQPGNLKGFEVTIPAKSLTSPKEGIDKNMHKALKVEEHPTIRFRLSALEPSASGYRATGMLTIAGVDKQVVLAMQAQRTDAGLSIAGTTDLLMTDFGVVPPKAMLGMLKTNPQVKIRIELLLGGPLT
jgi:polyisoprenoid-binding protein YceI